MLPFQESDLYKIVLSLTAVAELVEEEVMYDPGHAIAMLQERAIAMLLDAARAGNSHDGDRLRYLDEVRVSALICAALFDVCRHRSVLDERSYKRSKHLLERIIELVDAQQQ
jgi:hypothetical protein